LSTLVRQDASIGVIEFAAVPELPACSPSWLSTVAAASVLQAMVVSAGPPAHPGCADVRRSTLRVEVLVLDRTHQSLGDFIVHDMPAIFGSTLGSFASLGTVTAMSDLVHRVVDLTLTVERDGAAAVQLQARGAAGISLGSLKMLDDATPVPPELVSVAFVQALRQLDVALAAAAARHCPATAR
jgi:hypothetical protein